MSRSLYPWPLAHLELRACCSAHLLSIPSASTRHPPVWCHSLKCLPSYQSILQPLARLTVLKCGFDVHPDKDLHWLPYAKVIKNRSLSVAFIASNLLLSGLLFTAALHTPETVAVHFPTPGKSIWNIYLLFPMSTFKSSNYPLTHSSNHLLHVTMLVAPSSSNLFSCFCSLSIYVFFSSWHLAHSACVPFLKSPLDCELFETRDLFSFSLYPPQHLAQRKSHE